MTDDTIKYDTIEWREKHLGYAGTTCDLCREEVGDARPHAVENRQFVPALGNECFRELDKADRLDHERDAKIFGYGKHQR